MDMGMQTNMVKQLKDHLGQAQVSDNINYNIYFCK